MLAGDSLQCRGLDSLGKVDAVEETGETFLANSMLKASAYARLSGMWALADDSGIAVDALEGKPGVHSARWAAIHNAGQGDQANNELLLRQMDKVPDEKRTAQFVCVLSLANPQGQIILTARGEVAGRLLRKGAGKAGFGYDPLFYVDELGQTTAEVPAELKHRISHRGQALRRLKEMMARTPLFT